MLRKPKPLSEHSKALKEFLDAKGLSVWGTLEGRAAIESAVARHEAIEDLKTAMVLDDLNGKKWAENAFDEAFTKILLAYPVCTQWDYMAMTQYAVVVSDRSRAKMRSSFGNLTQQQSGTAARKEAEDAELEREYLEYMKGYPRATIKAFLKYYKNTDNAQTNNLEKRLKAIRKKNGMSKRSRSKTN